MFDANIKPEHLLQMKIKRDLAPTFSNFRQKLLMEQMGKIGGKYSRRAPQAATDFSSGEGKPMTKDRVRGMVFTSRPVYSDEYTDESFGDIEIPTER